MQSSLHWSSKVLVALGSRAAYSFPGLLGYLVFSLSCLWSGVVLFRGVVSCRRTCGLCGLEGVGSGTPVQRALCHGLSGNGMGLMGECGRYGIA